MALALAVSSVAASRSSSSKLPEFDQKYKGLYESTRVFFEVQEEKIVIDASSFVIVLTTFPADGDIAAFARTLVNERLAACVNVLPAMDSIYRWEGAVEEARERQVIMKTTAARVDELKARVMQLHSYEVPEILVLPLSGGGESYLKWIGESVRARQ